MTFYHSNFLRSIKNFIPLIPNVLIKTNPFSLRAAGNGEELVMQYFMDRNVPIDLKDGNGSTPLMIASSKGQLNAVAYLIRNGNNFMTWIHIFHSNFFFQEPGPLSWFTLLLQILKLETFRGITFRRDFVSGCKIRCWKTVIKIARNISFRQLRHISSIQDRA